MVHELSHRNTVCFSSGCAGIIGGSENRSKTSSAHCGRPERSVCHCLGGNRVQTPFVGSDEWNLEEVFSHRCAVMR